MAKVEHWDDWLENMAEHLIWDTHKMLMRGWTNDSGTHIPALKRVSNSSEITEAQNNDEKSRVLHKTFFPNASCVGETDVTTDTEYPPAASLYKDCVCWRGISFHKMLLKWPSQSRNIWMDGSLALL